MNANSSKLLPYALVLVSLHTAAPSYATEAGVSQKRLGELPRDLEIELALSALPPHLRGEANVHTLSAAGTFELTRRGGSEFHTLVSRIDPNAFFADWPFTEYRDDILVPIAFDGAGADALMPLYFDIAELHSKGTPAAELKSIINDRYASAHYTAPARPGVSYMLSPVVRTYMDAEGSDAISTWNVPHYMFYAPGVTNEEIGGKPMSQHPYVLNREAGPHGYIIQIVGAAEREAINEEHAELIDRLCAVRDLYCLSEPPEAPAR